MVFTFAVANGEILISMFSETDLGARSARFFKDLGVLGAENLKIFSALMRGWG